MEALTKEEVLNLKTLLIKFSENKLKGCKGFIKNLTESNSEEDIKFSFRYNRDEIFNELGGDIYELEDNIEDLEGDIKELENEIEVLNEQLEYSFSFGDSVDDQFKLRFVKEHHEKYTPWELEELLVNGKKYLNKQ
jgi:hypothetical protein